MSTPDYEYFGMVAEFWDLFRGDTSNWDDRFFFLDVVKKHGQPVLDVGCGTGRILLDFMSQSIDIDGVDNSPDMLARARAAHPYVAFVEADLASWEPEAPVDLIFTCNTYHHIENRPRYFSRAAEAIRSGGRLVVIDFYADHRSGDLGFPKDHLISHQQVIDELTEAGYRLAREHTFLPRQYFLEFLPPSSHQ